MDFYKRMQYVCAQIPYGKVSTYGQIALLCGMPKNARQAGYALSHRLMGNEIPAHRIVNAKGVLSGAQAFETPELQKQLLEAEGVQVEWTPHGWQVDLKRFRWVNTREEAEELYRIFLEKKI